MFKGKIYIYKNLDGREEKIEREFDDPHDFQSFAKKHDLGFKGFSTPLLGVGERANLQNYFDTLLDKKLGLLYEEPGNLSIDEENTLVDLSKYDQEIKKIEYKKQHKDEILSSLKNTLQKLKEYKNIFKDNNQDSILQDIDSDTKKVEEEIKKLEK